MKECPHCTDSFEPTFAHRTYCSTECQRKANAKRQRQIFVGARAIRATKYNHSVNKNSSNGAWLDHSG